jgi:hypothetical protein
MFSKSLSITESVPIMLTVPAGGGHVYVGVWAKFVNKVAGPEWVDVHVLIVRLIVHISFVSNDIIAIGKDLVERFLQDFHVLSHN